MCECEGDFTHLRRQTNTAYVYTCLPGLPKACPLTVGQTKQQMCKYLKVRHILKANRWRTDSDNIKTQCSEIPHGLVCQTQKDNAIYRQTQRQKNS